MNFVSLFSGVGGFDLGLEAAGLTCVAQVEWDKDCQQVLAHHWPHVPRWGDITDVHGADLPPADVVAFGSPCQDLSVAGNRTGFVDGGRSNLFHQAIRIVKEMRHATADQYPTFVVWENVVGALSSNDGRDFAAVLDAMADCGALDICWRVLNAQHFGVPQRRRRIFVVADLAGERAGQILAEPPSVRRDTDKGQDQRQSAADESGSGTDDDCVTFDLSIIGSSSVAATLNSGGNRGGFRTEPGEHLVIIP